MRAANHGVLMSEMDHSRSILACPCHVWSLGYLGSRGWVSGAQPASFISLRPVTLVEPAHQRPGMPRIRARRAGDGAPP